MAGHGPAPKLPEQRRNFTKPQRGEWIFLAPATKRPPAMPAAPKGGWARETKYAWRAWWTDPASTMWSPADIASVRTLAYLHHDLERGKTSLAAEIRLRMDGLGLTQKGKRDLRWRLPEVAAPAAEIAPDGPSRRELLRVVGT